MKIFFLCLCLAVGSLAVSDDEVLQQWNDFQQKFEKSYKSPLEARTRLAIFKNNLKEIEEHNARFANGEVTYDKGVNQFADWSADEFLQYVNKYQMPIREKNYMNVTLTVNDVPPSIDWRSNGAVSEVKNQGQCGGCWSFSATGALEGQAKIRLGQSLSLSEQNLIDCAVDPKYNCGGCNGGLMDGAFQYVSQYGVDLESNYPYEARQGPCRPRTVALRNNGYADVKPTEDMLQIVVATAGPASIGIEANHELQLYKSGILNDKSCQNKLNHGVLVVGYGEEAGNKYWIIKNSWGTTWGENGYLRLTRGTNNCGVALSASIPLL